MNLRSKMLLANSVGALALLCSTAAYAQIDEIIVTATKVEEGINDVPMSITAATGEQLEDRGITTVEDLSKITPGFSFQPAPYGNQTFNLRGIGNIDDSFASSATVALYVDQAPLPYSVMGQGLAFDVERVEVLKGPQGTLFGLNSTGGAINFIANKPGDVFEGGLRASLDNFGEVEASGHWGGPIGDTLGVRLSFLTQQGGAWQESVTRPDDELGDKNFLAGRVIVEWAPTDSLNFSLNVNRWENKNDTQAAQFIRSTVDTTNPFAPFVLQGLGTPTPPGDDNRAADWNDTNLTNDDSFSQFALTGSYDINDEITLTSITSFSDYEQFIIVDVDGTPFNALTQRQSGEIDSFSQELRLNGAIGDNLRWLVGANYATDEVEMNAFASLFGLNSFFPNFVPPGVPPFNSVANTDPTIPSVDNLNRQDVTTKAVFAGLDYSLSDTLTARASVRYTESENDFEGCFRDPGDGRFQTAINQSFGAAFGYNIANPGDCITADISGLPTSPAIAGLVQRNLEEDNVAFRVGLDWAMNEDSLIYGNITRGYKSGAFPNVPAVFANQNSPSPQEELMAYELGFKTTMNDTLQLDGSVFFYDYNDKQLTGTVNVPPPLNRLRSAVSAPEAEVLGLELTAKWAPTDDLLVSLGGTYLDAKITSTQLNGPDGLQDAIDPLGNPVPDISGSSFPTTPELSLQGDIQYEFADKFYAGLGFNYRGDTQSQIGDNPEFLIDSYTLLDARLGMDVTDKVSVEVWGDNILDEFYVTSVNSVISTLSRHAGRPATYGVTLDFDF